MKDQPDSVSVTFIGSGDAFGSGGRNNTCFLVRKNGLGVCLDFGASTLPALKREGYSTNDVTHVVITHLHGDHFGGLPFLFLDALFIENRTRPLIIYCQEGGEVRIRHLTELMYPGIWEKLTGLEIDFREYEAEATIEEQAFRLETLPVAHSNNLQTAGVRLSLGNCTIAYSGDTEWTDTLIRLADQADLFICECNFWENASPGHLDWRTLQSKRVQLKYKKLILTHLGPEMLEHVSEVDAEVALDGLKINL